MCDAYRKVFAAINEAGGRSSDDQNLNFTIAVNTRLAILANSSYLKQKLAENPATPSELAQSLKDMSDAYDEILLAQLASAPESTFKPLNDKLDAADATAARVCG